MVRLFIVLATTPLSMDYALTDFGAELIPAIVEVGSKLNFRTMTEAASCAA